MILIVHTNIYLRSAWGRGRQHRSRCLCPNIRRSKYIPAAQLVNLQTVADGRPITGFQPVRER